MMKRNILEYKGYHTTIEFDAETFTLRGKIEGINDYVDFASKDIVSVEQEFHNAVDEYLIFCEEVGKEPDKEYKGTFNIRIQPDLHKKLAFLAYRNGDTLNTSVEKAIQEYVTNNTSVTNTQIQQTLNIITEALATQTVHINEDVITSNIDSNIVPFKMYENSPIKMSYQETRSN